MGARRVEDITGKPKETTNLASRGSQGMDQQPGSLHGTNLVIYVTVVYCDRLVYCVGLLTMGAEAVPNTLTGSWEPIPHAELPCPALIQGGMFSLMAA